MIVAHLTSVRSTGHRDRDLAGALHHPDRVAGVGDDHIGGVDAGGQLVGRHERRVLAVE